MCSDKGRTYFPVTFKTSNGRPAVISNPGLSRENPVLSHRNGLTLTHSDSPDDIVHYGLACKHKNQKQPTIPQFTLKKG